MSPGISQTEKLEGDTFPGDLPGRQRRTHIVSVKQLSAKVEGFLGRHATCRPEKFCDKFLVSPFPDDMSPGK
nr:hypothetical protein [Tanacetum cinerariifolium]